MRYVAIKLKEMDDMPQTCEECVLETEDEDFYGDTIVNYCPCLYKGYTDKIRNYGRMNECPLIIVEGKEVQDA